MTAGLFRTLTRLSLCSRRRFRRVPSSSKPSPGCPCAGDDGFEDCRALQNPHESAPAQETTVSKMMSSAKPSPEGWLAGVSESPCCLSKARLLAHHGETTVSSQTINSGPGAAERRWFHPNHQLPGLGRPGDDGFIQTINSRAWGGPETTVSSKPSTPGPGAARRRRFHPNHQLPDLGRPGDDGFIQTINSRAWGGPETTVSSKPSTPGPGAFGDDGFIQTINSRAWGVWETIGHEAWIPHIFILSLWPRQKVMVWMEPSPPSLAADLRLFFQR